MIVQPHFGNRWLIARWTPSRVSLRFKTALKLADSALRAYTVMISPLVLKLTNKERLYLLHDLFIQPLWEKDGESFVRDASDGCIQLAIIRI